MDTGSLPSPPAAAAITSLDNSPVQEEYDSEKKAKRAPRRRRCGKCEGCTKSECGVCRCCRSKTKFGGKGSVGSCVLKKCTNLLPPNAFEGGRGEAPVGKRKKRKRLSFEESVEYEAQVLDEEQVRLLNTFTHRSTVYDRPVPKFTANKCSSPSCLFAKSTSSAYVLAKCLGYNCGRMYHKKCAEELQLEINDGDHEGSNPANKHTLSARSIVCPDCDYFGTSLHLLRYFEYSENSKSMFRNSKEYVEKLILDARKDAIECDEDGTDLFIEFGCPRSEFSYLTRFLNAVNNEKTFVSVKASKEIQNDINSSGDLQNDHNDDKINERFNPSILVGQFLRLYNPLENNYHSGRIINYRRAAKVDKSMDYQSQFYGPQYDSPDKEIFITEYLVVFNAGMEGRKCSIQRWMLLEEHSVSVFCKEVWACFKPEQGITKKDSYRPGYLIVRSTIEIIPDRDVEWERNNENGGSIALCLISSSHSIVPELESQVFRFTSPIFQKERYHPPDRSVAIMGAIANANAEEATRVFRWHEMYLKNRFHPKGLSLMNMNSLPRLYFPSRNNSESNAKSCPRDCPSLSQGLDQLWLCDMVKELTDNHVIEIVESLRCKKVESKRKALQSAIRDLKEV